MVQLFVLMKSDYVFIPLTLLRHFKMYNTRPLSSIFQDDELNLSVFMNIDKSYKNDRPDIQRGFPTELSILRTI